MSWWVIDVGFDDRQDSDAIAAMLVVETGQTVEQRSDRVLGSARGELPARAAARALSEHFGAGLDIAVKPAPSVDWATSWREGLAVRRIGRLEIGPSWLLAPGPLRVVVDPETAFGTGEHGSTRGALALLERHLAPGARVLDLGSGSGILAIAAARLGAGRALGIEIDEDAIPVAEANARHNEVLDRVDFVPGEARVLAPLAGPVDVVLSNILRTVNLTLLEAIHASLGPGGIAIFAGMEALEAELFRGPLEAGGFAVADEIVDDNWWAVLARKR